VRKDFAFELALFSCL